MSRQHRVVQGDMLINLSVRYYGVPGKWTDIRDANPQLQGRKTAIDGSPLIFPEDMLIIPDEVELAPELNTATPQNLAKTGWTDFSIVIDGKKFTSFTDAEITSSIDSFDTFSFGAPWDDTVADQKAAFLPFAYKSCAVYYKDALAFNGQLLTPNPSATPNSRMLSLQGYPLCGPLNECALPDTKYPPEYSGKTILQIAEDAAKPFGIRVRLDGTSGSAFDKVAYNPGDSLLSFFAGLAKQRDLLITNNAQGELLFWHAQNSAAVAAFKEGELPFLSCQANFDPQKFFSHITGYTKTDKKTKSQKYTYENKYLTDKGVLRPHSFTIEDADGSNVEAATKAYAGRMFGSCVSYTLTVMGSTDFSEELYHKNSIVTVLSPGAMIYRETKLLVKKAAIKHNDSDGEVTTLELVLPGSYTGELPEAFPWEE